MGTQCVWKTWFVSLNFVVIINIKFHPGLGSDVKEEILRLPTLLRFLALKKMKMVACGNDHMAGANTFSCSNSSD